MCLMILLCLEKWSLWSFGPKQHCERYTMYITLNMYILALSHESCCVYIKVALIKKKMEKSKGILNPTQIQVFSVLLMVCTCLTHLTPYTLLLPNSQTSDLDIKSIILDNQGISYLRNVLNVTLNKAWNSTLIISPLWKKQSIHKQWCFFTFP